ncbi:putative lipoprotein GfcB precursor [Marinomonas spartinae]|uniref:Putative lipoprotein GfcB n=1 Tax=Marinomonas spartinae TaxID=1792290 RepID=A0A1A8T549_9GAMM|nr:YjbF family lipoprotein [Marinomonas spartinae]SBS27108.1 putative lipoprotein GfcB precursor [Marinomonas spartinae]
MNRYRSSHRSIAYLLPTLLVLPLLLTGCAQAFRDNIATVKAAWDANTNAQISSEQIRKLSYASIFLRVNNGPRAFVVAAFADTNKKSHNTQLTWLSTDNVMITTEKGRIVKTLGFKKDNLASLSINTPNTEKLSYNTTPKEWNATYDWQPNFRYNFIAQVTQKDLGYETLTTPLWQEKTHHIEETVTIPKLNVSFKNEFWVNKHNKVVKTIQYLGPNMNKLEITFLKPYQH